MNINTKFPFLYVLITGVILWSCNADELQFDDVKQPVYEAPWSLKIGKETLFINDFIDNIEGEKLKRETSAAGLIALTHYDTTLFDDYSSLVKLNDQNYSGNIEVDTVLSNIGIDEFVALPDEELVLEYDLGIGQELDSIYFDGGSVRLDITSTFADVDINFGFIMQDIITIKNNASTGVPDTMRLEGVLAPGETKVVEVPMSGYKSILNREGTKSIYKVIFRSSIKLENGDQVIRTEGINYTLEMQSPTFTGVFGYFGEREFDAFSKTLDIDVFSSFEETGLKFGDPKIGMTFVNSFGVPFGIDLSTISASNASETVSLTGDISGVQKIAGVRHQNTSGVIKSDVGEEVTSSITINKENSNIIDLFALNPTRFTMDVSGVSNFGVANTNQDRNFVLDSLINGRQLSKLSAIFSISLPLNIQLKDYRKEINVDVSEFNHKQTDTVQIKILAANEIPFSGKVDVSVLNGETILNTQNDILIIESPQLKTNGNIEEKVTNEGVISFYGETLDYLRQADNLRLTLIVNTVNTDIEGNEVDFVNIFSKYSLELDIYARVHLSIDLNE